MRLTTCGHTLLIPMAGTYREWSSSRSNTRKDGPLKSSRLHSLAGLHFVFVEFVRNLPHRLRDILALPETLEIVDQKILEQRESEVQRASRIVCQVAHY